MSKNTHLKAKMISALSVAVIFMLAPRSSASNRSFTRANNSQVFVAREALSFDQEQILAELSKKIAGQESKPAKEVFKNIQQLESLQAGRLLRAMGSFGRALGVGCAHCHVVDQWEKDDKPAKQITRDMLKMVTIINRDQLKSIKNLKGEVSVTCWTCHRGQTTPDFRIPEARPKQ